MDGNRALYQELLQEFHTDFAATEHQFAAELAAGQTEAALRRVHNLKSAAGHLGATGLQTAAGELEGALRRGESKLDQWLDPLRHQLRSLLQALAATLLSQEDRLQAATLRARPAGSAKELRALLKQLQEPLRKYQPRPCQQLMTTLLQKTWPEKHRSALAELEHEIMTGRLAPAATTVERLLA